VRAGADLVAFSGDKLLGGPQAGIIVGRRALIDRLARHPLNRALRVDKLTVVALEATLELYREGLADEAVPARALVQQAPALLEVRATRLQALLAAHGVPSRVLSVSGRVGGGSMPLAELSSFAVAVAGPLGDRLRALRTGTPAVLGRVADDSLELDVRCIADADVEALAEAVARVFGAPR
jgi:L-seryl-tRNA(Ser) seleniumtransferase